MSKIFVIGFPKAGTSSIHDAIEKSGLKSLHWGWYNSPEHMPCHVKRGSLKITSVGLMIKHAKDLELPLLYFINKFDAFTQMDMTLSNGRVYWPQLTDVPLLDKQYPNSKFIFNTRPMDKWISSVNRWNDLKIRLTKAHLPGLPQGVGYKDQELVDWNNWHKNNMINYFGKNDEKFIIFDIEKDNPEILGRFLNIKNLQFGHKNENKRNTANNSLSMPTSIRCEKDAEQCGELCC